MKKLFCLIFLILVCNSFSEVAVGGKTGLNISSARVDSDIRKIDANFIPGFQMGYFCEFQLTPSVLGQVEFLYSTKGYGYDFDSTGTDIERTVRVQNIEIPILFKPILLINDNVNIFLIAGLYTAIAFDASTISEYDNEEVKSNYRLGLDEEDDMEHFDMGFKIGIEFEYPEYPVFFDFIYQNGFLDLASDSESFSDHRNQTFEFAIGYKFGDINRSNKNIKKSTSKRSSSTKKKVKSRTKKSAVPNGK